MPDDKHVLSRSDMLARLAIAPIAIGALASLRFESEAATKSAKSAVQYVDKSPKAQKCAQCRFYIAAKKNPKTAKGQCQIVQGSIAPQGYCVAYAAKSK